MTTLTTKILEVTAKTPAHDCSESDKFFTFKAYELPNGVIAVPYESTNDGFFLDRDSIQGCGNDVIESVEDTGKTFLWDTEDLRKSVEASIKEFSGDDATSKALSIC